MKPVVAHVLLSAGATMGARRQLDPWIAIGLGALAGAPLAFAPLASAAACAGVAWALRRRVARWALAIALAVAVVAAWRARIALSRAAAAHDRARAALRGPTRCDGVATVLASPVALRAAREGSLRLDVDFAGHCGGEGATFSARLYVAESVLATAGRGDRLSIVADLAPVHLFANGPGGARAAIARSLVVASGGVVDASLLAAGAGPGAIVDRARASVRRRIDATFDADVAPLARALVLGETDLPGDDDAAFRSSGLAHLLAVSGTHLVLTVLFLVGALRALLVRIPPLATPVDVSRIAAAIGVPAVWIYADFAGGGGSAMRAAAMLSIALLARALGRRPRPVRAFALSLAGAGILDPLVACDASFALSAAATAGLLVLGGPIAAPLARLPAPLARAAEPVATTLAAMLGCAPVLAWMAPTLPVLGVVANVAAAPLGEIVALPLCLAHAALAWAPAAERGAAVIASIALSLVRTCARWTAGAGGALAVPPPTPWQLAALALMAALIAAATTRRARLASAAAGAAAWLVLEIGAVRAGRPRDRLRITFVDVGQGDAALVDLPDGGAMLVDGGGLVGSPVDVGERVLLPLLRARRRARLDVVVLSHPHPDHFGGLAAVVASAEVGEIWDTGQGEEGGRDAGGAGYVALLDVARRRGVPVRRPGVLCGTRSVGGARVEVLAPCPGVDPDAAPNDASFVLRIGFGRRRALLVGDAERTEEGRLLASGAPLAADVLKVGHHGSRTSSTSTFLDAVLPSFAVVSCGVRNRFGHPHATTLEAFAERSIPVARTDEGGAVVWETDGDEVRIDRPGL